jgi:hyperosmotically inducible protein
MESTAMKQLKTISTLILAAMLATVLGCASTSKQEGTGEYIDDSVITTKVKAAVFNEPSLKSAEINVETFKGVVQLSGFVSTTDDINKAVEITRNVKGVTSVKNDMRVKSRQ